MGYICTVCYPIVFHTHFIVVGAPQRMWALQKLRKLMTSHFGPNINVNMLINSPTADGLESDAQKGYGMVSNDFTQ